MALIGNPILSTDFPVDYASGNGSTTSFTLSVAPASVNAIDVQVAGVVQSPKTYTISGNTLTFSSAPASGTNNIVVKHRGVIGSTTVPALGSITIEQHSATGTPSSSTFLRGDNTWAPAGLSDVVTPGSAGSTSQIPVISINAKGQVVSLSGASLDLSAKLDTSGSANPTISNTAPTISLTDTDQSVTKKIHHNSNLIGFLGNSDQWIQYVNNSGQINTPAYGWLHEYFVSGVSNCLRSYSFSYPGGGNTGNCAPGQTGIVNCYGGGNLALEQLEVVDNGSTIGIRSVNYYYNCNCNCQCNC